MDDFEARMAATDASFAGGGGEQPYVDRAGGEHTDPQDISVMKNIDQVSGVLGSIATGAAKAGIESKDFVSGLFGNSEPNFEDKWQVRKYIERKGEDLKRENVVNGIAQSLSQFGTGFIGLGKVKWVAQGLQKAKDFGKAAGLAAESLRGATVGFVAMDPHDERLSNLVEAYPSLSNPITNYLAAKPTDSDAEGRLKNALEGIILDTVLVGGLALAAKAIKLYRAGNIKAANEAAAEADAAFTKANDKPSAEQALLQSAERSDTVPSPKPGEAADAQGNVGGTGDGTGARIDGTAPAAPDAPSAAPDVGGGPDAPGPRPGDGSGGPLREGEQWANELSGSSGETLGSKPGASERAATTDFTPEQIDLHLARLRKDNEALAFNGTRTDAIENGYKFKGGGDEAGIIPYQKLNTTQAVQGWMGQLIEDHAKYINKVRGGNAEGVLKDKAVDRLVQARADMWGDDPAKLRGIIEQAGDEARDVVVNMETSFLLANKAYQDSYGLAVRIVNDNFEGFGSKAAALQELQKRMVVATTMYATGKSIISNSARAMRRMRGEFQITDDMLAGITSSNPDELAKLVASTGGNPTALTKVAKMSLVHNIVDAVSGYQAANLLWGWKTQVVNAASSAAMTIWRPLETGLGSLPVQALGALKGNPEMVAQAQSIRTQSLREVTYLSSTLNDAFFAGVEAFKRGDSVIIPHSSEQMGVAATLGAGDLRDIGQAWVNISSIGDVAQNLYRSSAIALGGSLRVMGSADEMFKTMRYRAVVAAKASVDADAQGLQAGTQAYKDFVSKRLDGAFDDFGRAIDENAIAEAKATTFQNDLLTADDTWFGGWAKGYSGFIAHNNVFKLITPFVKTPTNLIRYGIKLTPGVNMLQREYMNAMIGAKGPEEQARAVGQMMMGITLSSMAATMWASGRVVGAGPQNVEQKNEWLKQGNRPYSLVWYDDQGNKKHLELNRFDPLATPFLMVADYMSVLTSGHVREEDAQNMASSMVLTFAHLMREKTYLRNLSEFTKAMTDDKFLESWSRRMTPGFVPFSTLMPTFNPDPVVHETRSIVDAAMSRVPGLSASLPPQRDMFGEVVMAPTGFVSAQKNAGSLALTLDSMFAATGRFIEPPSPKQRDVDLRDFKLKASGRTAYDRYQELIGKPADDVPTLKKTLTDLVESDTFKNVLVHGGPQEKGTKASAIADVVAKYRQAALAKLMVENDDLRDAMYQRQREIGIAVEMRDKANRDKQSYRPDKLLNTYGITR